MTDYPAKPPVTPQTGRTPPDIAPGEAKWLSGVTTSELRQMMDFKDGHLFLFLVKHLEKKISLIKTTLAERLDLAESPHLLSALQGEIKGIREFERLFQEIDIEYKRRVAREEALNQGTR